MWKQTKHENKHMVKNIYRENGRSSFLPNTSTVLRDLILKIRMEIIFWWSLLQDSAMLTSLAPCHFRPLLHYRGISVMEGLWSCAPSLGRSIKCCRTGTQSYCPLGNSKARHNKSLIVTYSYFVVCLLLLPFDIWYLVQVHQLFVFNIKAWDRAQKSGLLTSLLWYHKA